MKTTFSKASRGIWLALFVSAFMVLTAGAGAVRAQSAGAATPEEAVTTLVRPLYDPAANNAACNALTGKVDDCPITEQLRTRLQNPIPNVETGNLVGRNQNPPSKVIVSLLDSQGDTAHVNTSWEYNPGMGVDIVFTVQKVGGGWLVADSMCSGDPTTSIFNSPTGPCPALTSGPAGPGMPNTGGGFGSDYTLSLAIGILTLVTGVALVLAARLVSDRPRTR